ncbi:MAG: hypothetical protein K2O06_04340 [Acetatifactor sp.]|nr:hypothetical protein [Acetatifactor sp.]
MSKDSREAAKSSAGTALRMARAERTTTRKAAKSAAACGTWPMARAEQMTIREAAKSSAGTALRMAWAERMTTREAAKSAAACGTWPMARAERTTTREAAKSAALTPQSKPKRTTHEIYF